MVPVDLAHSDKLDRALTCAADLALRYDATVVYTAVTAATPGKVAHSPKEFAAKLDAFAAEQAGRFGIQAESKMLVSHDPSVDLDPTLLEAIEDEGADLVVMASHVPNVTDYIWASNGATIARKAKITVMLVR
nr:universal stress protein [Marivita sp. GX14005]